LLGTVLDPSLKEEERRRLFLLRKVLDPKNCVESYSKRGKTSVEF
jgi:hypothetical protein